MRKNKFLKKLRIFVSRNKFVRTILYPIRIIRLFFLRIPQKWQMNILTNLSDLLVEDTLVRVDEFGGVFSISGRSSLFQRLIISKSYEPELVKIVKLLIDQQKDVIDVGANIGFYTVMFNNLIDDNRKVLAIEPTSKALQRLRKNLLLNQADKKVIIFEGGVSDIQGFLEIKTILGKEEYSTLGAMTHPSTSEQKIVIEQVQVSTLDILVDKYSLTPGFIKIDVEGVEPLVIRGMQNLLQKYKPIVILEWDELMLKSNGFIPLEVINWFEKYDYRVFDPLAPSYPPNGNMLCIPIEHVDEFLGLLNTIS